jgi:hypothetical protein
MILPLLSYLPVAVTPFRRRIRLRSSFLGTIVRAAGLKGEAVAVSAEFPLIGRPVEDRRAGEKFQSLRGPHAGCLNAVASIGSFRRRLPVAAKIALVTAGTMAEVPGSPIPPGGSEL